MSTQPQNIDEQKVRDVAALANLHLTDDEVKRYVPQLQSILKEVEKLSEVDTSDEEFTTHIDLKNVLREDIPKDSLSQDEVTSNRKDSASGGAFTIKSVLKK